MMRPLKIWPAAAYFAALAMPLFANAQQPSEIPPKLEKLEEGEAPAITIRKPDSEQKITEKRQKGGKVTEIKVQRGKSTYYLRPNDAVGSVLPGDAQSSSRPPQWKIKEFDLGGEQQAKKAVATQTPPPPAASEPQKK